MFDKVVHRYRRIAFRVVRFVMLVYVSILIFMVGMESRLVFPGAYFGQSAVFVEGDIETVDTDPTSDWVLPSRLIERPEPRHHVLFLHGNGVRAAELDQWSRRLSKTLDATVLTAEYRGYEDDRTPNETGVIADAEAAHDFLLQRYDLNADEVVIYGCSLGGGCAAALASDRGVKVLILDRTFDAAWKVAASKYPFIPVSLLMRNRFDSVSRLADYRGPVVQIHGTADSLIPIDRGKALFDQLGTDDKVWIEVPGMEHNDQMSDQVMQQIADAVQRLTTTD